MSFLILKQIIISSSGIKEVGADRMIPDHDLEVILTAAIVDLDPDLALEVIKGIHILGHTHDLIHDREAVPLPYLEDKDPHLSLTSGELQGKHHFVSKPFFIIM